MSGSKAHNGIEVFIHATILCFVPVFFFAFANNFFSPLILSSTPLYLLHGYLVAFLTFHTCPTSVTQAAGNAVKRASDNLVRAAQKAAFSKADDDNVVVKTRFVGGIAQVSIISDS